MTNTKNEFLRGMKNGIPIAAGYFAVSFALGISAANAGLTSFQAFLSSLLSNASAGEYAGFTVIAGNGSYIEMMVISAIVNARYLLMSASLSQKLENIPFYHRLFTGFCVTDEIFGASVTEERLNPFYTYGLAVMSLSFWGFGTFLGAKAGNILPERISEAMGVLLYGMFLAIIMPPARNDRHIRGAIIISMLLSLICCFLPFVKELSEGTRIIIITILVSWFFALLFPRKEE